MNLITIAATVTLAAVWAGGAHGACADRLLGIHPDWAPDEISVACYDAGPDCVVALATAQPTFAPGDLNLDCRDDYWGNCAGRLATSRPAWDSSELSIACYGADPNCVVNSAVAAPSWQPGDLNLACRYGRAL